MRLADVFPRAEIAAAVPRAVFRDLDVQGLEAFTADNPNTMIAFGFATWDHALSSGRHDDLDPQMLAGPINDEDPRFIRHVEAALGQRALLDFHYAEARTPGAPEPFASVSLAHLSTPTICISATCCFSTRTGQGRTPDGSTRSRPAFAFSGFCWKICGWPPPRWVWRS